MALMSLTRQRLAGAISCLIILVTSFRPLKELESADSVFGKASPASASAQLLAARAGMAGHCRPGPSINQWAALGDGYAAGPGAGKPFDNDTHCKRYSEAYPLALFTDPCMPGHDDPARKPNFIACSGAMMQDVKAHQVPNVQLNNDMMTLSIGGNNVEVEEILKACIFQPGGSSTTNCTNTIAASKAVTSSAQFANDWTDLTTSILGKLSNSTSSTIFVTGYTNFFSEDLSNQCNTVSFSYSSSNQTALTGRLRQQLNELPQILNWYLHYFITRTNRDLGANKLVFVEYDEKFNGHRFCRPNVTEPDGNNRDTWFFNLNSVAPSDDIMAQNFRPTSSGHAGIKDAVLEHLLGLPALNGLNLRIMPLGDSITFGYRSSDGNGYRQYLLTALAGNNVKFIGSQKAGTMTNNENEGHSGAIIDQIASYAYLSLPERPNVVLLMAGTNDMNNNVDPDGAPARLSALIDEILAACPDAVVVVAQIIPAANLDTFTRLTTYNARISLLVNQKQTAGKHVIKAWMPLTTDDLSDGLHPNDLGYSKMANGWIDALVRAKSKDWIGQPVVINNTGEQPTTHPPNWIPQGEISLGYGGTRDEIRFADLNSDGRAEYLWIHPNSSVDAWLNLGGPDDGPNAAKVGWQPQGTIATGVGANGSDIQFADLNGDGRADYLWIHTDGSVEAWLNLASHDDGADAISAAWAYQGKIASGLGKNGSEVKFADLNGDGRAEYLWIHPDGSVEAFLNLGSSNASTFSWQPLGTVATGIGKSSTGLEFGDINGDARADYLWVDPSNGAVTAYLSSGGPGNRPDNSQIHWIADGIIATGVGTDGSGVRFADLNGDGRVEYLNLDVNGAVTAWLNE